MKKGFTLIELLIVTAVIVTLMSIMFRLANTGGSSRAKAHTIDRMQRIENALSGYYAAFGSYPPVPLQGRSRSIEKRVDAYGLQESGNALTGEKFTGGGADSEWTKVGKQILAACKAQPVMVNYLFDTSAGDMQQTVSEFSNVMKEHGIYSSTIGLLTSPGGLNGQSADWREVSVFKFGLLSFLLPRYFFMLRGAYQFYDSKNFNAQWTSNNKLPCRLDTGVQFENWKEIQKFLGQGSGLSSSGSIEASMISNLTSQSVCARWMPNFERIISGGQVFFGVDTSDPYRGYLNTDLNSSYRPAVHSKNGYTGSVSGGGSSYLLDGMTIRDGWYNEFFYASDPPYQSYTLWSSGANGRTFPPWIDRSKLNAQQRKVVQSWTEDDITGLNN